MKVRIFVVLDGKVVLAPVTQGDLIKYLLESDDDTLARIAIMVFKENREFQKLDPFLVLDTWMTKKQENEGE